MKLDIAAKTACAGTALAAALLLTPAMAHHSSAMFDDEVELTLSGVVTRFDYLNPHAWLYVNVQNDDGTHTEWGFELGAPPRLRRSGISPNFWQAGDAVTVKTNPLKDGRPAGSLGGAINAAGKTFGNASGLAPPAAD
ncbi:DUF6152 family protein [Candidatus Rariloculus sp.]|uniref:DUF6152 family protein n=1 Tax=Candidatus Rariloculus sp. TaxID=3101265 RepID=UPI003D1311E3